MPALQKTFFTDTFERLKHLEKTNWMQFHERIPQLETPNQTTK